MFGDVKYKLEQFVVKIMPLYFLSHVSSVALEIATNEVSRQTLMDRNKIFKHSWSPEDEF